MLINLFNKKSYFTLLLFLSHTLLFAQKEWNNWYFGWWAGLSFNTNPPSVLMNSNLATFFGTVSVSDSSGNLLFYSDGRLVMNRNDTLMPNGTFNWLNQAGQPFQPVVTTRDLLDQSIFYLFFSPGLPAPHTLPHVGLRYSVIDMRLDNGLGDVVPGMSSIALNGAHDASSAVTAIRHANNQFTWIVTRIHNPDSNFYASYLVDDGGVINNPVFSNSLVALDWNYDPLTRMIRISPDGKNLICCYTDRIEVCFFNSQTGVVTPRFIIIPKPGNSAPYYPESAEFSIDSKLLYVSNKFIGFGGNNSTITQYDMTTTDSLSFKNSETAIGNTRYSALQYAPDGKIYGTQYYMDSLCIINHPEVKGSGCQFQENAIFLNGKMSQLGLPQFLQRYFAYINHTGFCQGAPISFEPNTWPPPDSLWWNFGDPASGAANFSNDSTPQHIFENEGTFTVQMIVRHIDMRYDTAILNLTIEPQPAPNLGPDLTLCENQYVTLDAGYNPQWSYLWSTGDTTPTITVSTSGTYYVNVTSPNGCSDSDEVVITFMPGNKPQPKPIKHN